MARRPLLDGIGPPQPSISAFPQFPQAHAGVSPVQSDSGRVDRYRHSRCFRKCIVPPPAHVRAAGPCRPTDQRPFPLFPQALVPTSGDGGGSTDHPMPFPLFPQACSHQPTPFAREPRAPIGRDCCAWMVTTLLSGRFFAFAGIWRITFGNGNQACIAMTYDFSDFSHLSQGVDGTRLFLWSVYPHTHYILRCPAIEAPEPTRTCAVRPTDDAHGEIALPTYPQGLDEEIDLHTLSC